MNMGRPSIHLDDLEFLWTFSSIQSVCFTLLLLNLLLSILLIDVIKNEIFLI